jgi:hypothetical protein
MNQEQEMLRIKSRIADVYARREGLKDALETGAIAPIAGFAQLETLDGELSDLDIRYKTLWDDAHAISPHPAAIWAVGTDFEAAHLDCVTAIMLKILDGKCKMGAAEKNALTAVYDVVKVRPRQGLASEVHGLIAAARQHSNADTDANIAADIHTWRVRAEEHIPKPVMKGFKQLLRSSLPMSSSSQGSLS